MTTDLAAEGLQTAVRGRVLEITLARPERRNALTPALIRGLIGVLDRARTSDDLRAVLLTGAGEKAFCAGFDIALIDSPGGKGVSRHARSPGGDAVGAERDLVEDLAGAVVALPLPVVAAVNGAAVGAGCDLAVACDLRIGVPGARFGMPPARLGILYGWKGVDRLVRSIGLPAAKDLLLTGRLMDAARAYDLGLLSAVVPPAALLDEARAITDTLAANAPLSVAASKRMTDLLSSPSPPSDGDLEELAALQQRVWTSEDAVEGARAYRERRPPQFTGR